MSGSIYLATSTDVMAQPVWQLSDSSTSATLERALKTHKRGHCAGTMIKLEGGKSKVTYCVLSGWASLSKSMPDGQRQIIDFALPGDFLDPRSADNATSALQIEAVTYAVIAEIPDNLWHQLGETIPQLKTLEHRVIAGALSRLAERMLRLGKGSAEARIAHAIIELCIRLRAIGQERDCSFHLPLTQQQLGEFVGLSSVHVCRTMRRLKRLGVISMEDHIDISIHDMDALAEIAGVDPDMLENEIVPHL
jgi:CRP-like cAMP-binding protein